MCGTLLPAGEKAALTMESADPSSETAVSPPTEPASRSETPAVASPKTPAVVTSVVRERRSSLGFWITAVITIILLGAGALYLRENRIQLAAALLPTLTPIPPTPSYTPTWTPPPSETPPPTETPTLTPTLAPTDTPQPPRFHTVASGETLFGISLFYRIAVESIAAANGLTTNSPIQVGQNLEIPWPTPTPPLESMVLEINDETVIADVSDCQIYALEPGDSVYGMAGRFDVPAEAIIAVNRLTEETIQFLQPGDTFCIPKITFSDTLPPTPGPSPTPTLTPFPAGPSLLYPVNESVINPPDSLVRVQWVAVKDLAPDEWYMVELTNLDELDALPLRGFTRDTAFDVPTTWRPVVEGTQAFDFRWRVSIVKVTGERVDGEFIYTFGGRASDEAIFTWQGATPTPTPTPTPLPTATPAEQ